MEENPSQAILTNIEGTKNLADCEHNVEVCHGFHG
jgi:FlaA1/EpsC-like NDP-sugar epimerase